MRLIVREVHHKKNVKVCQHIKFFTFFCKTGSRLSESEYEYECGAHMNIWEEGRCIKGLETLLRLPGSQEVFCNGKFLNKIQIQKKKKKKITNR